MKDGGSLINHNRLADTRRWTGPAEICWFGQRMLLLGQCYYQDRQNIYNRPLPLLLLSVILSFFICMSHFCIIRISIIENRPLPSLHLSVILSFCSSVWYTFSMERIYRSFWLAIQLRREHQFGWWMGRLWGFAYGRGGPVWQLGISNIHCSYGQQTDIQALR